MRRLVSESNSKRRESEIPFSSSRFPESHLFVRSGCFWCVDSNTLIGR
ncbi:unnamed protein product, partial [Musa acuminata var. zebrina]